MKKCSYCGRVNHDEATCCLECGTQDFHPSTDVGEAENPLTEHAGQHSKLDKPESSHTEAEVHQKGARTALVLLLIVAIGLGGFVLFKMIGPGTVPGPSKILTVPLMGKWRLKGMPPDQLYIISERDGIGRIAFETKGLRLNERMFDAKDAETIIIRDAKRGPHTYELYTAQEILEIVMLKDAPQELRFAGSEEILEMHGLFGRFPLTLIRDPEDLAQHTRATSAKHQGGKSAPDEITLEGELRVEIANEGGLSFGAPVPRLTTQKGVYTLRTSSTKTKWVNIKVQGASVVYNLGARHRVRGTITEDDKQAIWVTYIEDLNPKK